MVRRTIEAPAQEVWRRLIDTRSWPLWGPSVRKVRADSRIIGPGSQGHVQVLGGLWLPFKINRFKHDHYWSWQIAGIDATGHRVTVIDHRHCHLTFEIPFWAAPYALVCLWAIKRMQRSIIEWSSA